MSHLSKNQAEKRALPPPPGCGKDTGIVQVYIRFGVKGFTQFVYIDIYHFKSPIRWFNLAKLNNRKFGRIIKPSVVVFLLNYTKILAF